MMSEVGIGGGFPAPEPGCPPERGVGTKMAPLEEGTRARVILGDGSMAKVLRGNGEACPVAGGWA